MIELTVKYNKKDFFGTSVYVENTHTITLQEESEKKFIAKALKKVIAEDFTLQIVKYGDLQTLIIYKEYIDRLEDNDIIQVRHYTQSNSYDDMKISIKAAKKYIKDFIQEV